MSWISVYNRPLYGCIGAGSATFGMVMGGQPLPWTAVAAIGGFVVFWITAPRKKNA